MYTINTLDINVKNVIVVEEIEHSTWLEFPLSQLLLPTGGEAHIYKVFLHVLA